MSQFIERDGQMFTAKAAPEIICAGPQIIERWIIDGNDARAAIHENSFWTEKFAPASYADERSARRALALKLSVEHAAICAAMSENSLRLGQIETK